MTPHRTRAQERADEIDVSPTKLLAEIDRLTGELQAARKSADEYLNALQRERAEFLNYKRRVADERQAMLGLAAESLLSKVLALADDFDRAIESRPESVGNDSWVEGIVAIDRKLRQLLESEGVTAIEAEPGQLVHRAGTFAKPGENEHPARRRERLHRLGHLARGLNIQRAGFGLAINTVPHNRGRYLSNYSGVQVLLTSLS